MLEGFAFAKLCFASQNLGAIDCLTSPLAMSGQCPAGASVTIMRFLPEIVS